MPYVIDNGVRRAKAALMAGQTEIECLVFHPDGYLLDQRRLPLEELRSPKRSIEVRNSVERVRFERILKGTRSGARLPPIEVQAGHKGVRLEEVTFER